MENCSALLMEPLCIFGSLETVLPGSWPLYFYHAAGHISCNLLLVTVTLMEKVQNMKPV